MAKKLGKAESFFDFNVHAALESGQPAGEKTIGGIEVHPAHEKQIDGRDIAIDEVNIEWF